MDHLKNLDITLKEAMGMAAYEMYQHSLEFADHNNKILRGGFYHEPWLSLDRSQRAAWSDTAVALYKQGTNNKIKL